MDDCFRQMSGMVENVETPLTMQEHSAVSTEILGALTITATVSASTVQHGTHNIWAMLGTHRLQYSEVRNLEC